MDKITKGKMNKISLDLIYDLNLILLPLETQELILSQIKLNNVIINNNNIQIKNLIDILNKFIDGMIYGNEKEKLNSYFSITNEIDVNSKIAIKKNSLSVGTIERINNFNNYQENTNYFYLKLNNNNENIDYFYYLMKYYKNDFVTSAFKNKSVSLSKNFVELFEIPILLKEEQNHLISICEYFYRQIELLENNNELLKETNVLSLLV